MLRGELTLLRSWQTEDLPILHDELHDDVAVRTRADNRPWTPAPAGPASPYTMPEAPETDPAAPARFSVVELASGDLAGEGILWGIDLHNRSAHVGISLRPAFRGRGLSTDVVRVLCHYGFAVRGMHRLQLETLADNQPMLAAAARAGFTVEGHLRKSAWVSGTYQDEVVLSQLSDEWSAP